MTRLVVRYYSPTHCAQYVLDAQAGVRLKLARDGELRLPTTEDDVAIELGLEGAQWFVRSLRGALRTSEGRTVDVRMPIVPRRLFTLGAATLVLDNSVDPHIPARPLQKVEPVPEIPFMQETRVFDLADLGLALPEVPAKTQAPAAKQRLAPPPQLKPEELSEARRIDEKPFEAELPEPSLDDLSDSEPTLVKPQSRVKLAAYSILGVAAVISGIGMMSPAAAETEARAATPPPPNAVPAASASARTKARAVEPTLSGPASSKRAADYYATGDWPNALAEYRALAASGDPAFSVIVRALERRVTRTSVKR